MNAIEKTIHEALAKAGIGKDATLGAPPKPDMGDFALSCFGLAKEQGKNPAEVAKQVADEIKSQGNEAFEDVKAFGPYVNFFLSSAKVVELFAKDLALAGKNFGMGNTGAGQKILVEFAGPNVLKAFHIGHLRNVTTGESLVRIFENSGYKVVRANYQGDVGLHIAKCLYGIFYLEDFKSRLPQVAKENLVAKAEFLGSAYAAGSAAYEADEKTKTVVAEINKKIYDRDPEVFGIYTEARQWSLAYLDAIYARVSSHFDRFFFESEVFKRAQEIVAENTPKVFRLSEGATIFPGSEVGLHDRVFLNSQGLPTYEAKDLALAELQFSEFSPDHIYHVVAKEQTDYFKVVFRALESVLPKSAGREHHLAYGWLQLKGAKMSSRLGNVVLGEWLIDEVKKSVAELMAESTARDKETVAEKVAVAAVKYAMLKTGVGNDIAFDIKESVSLSGDSGPYVLYVCARIKSIIRKAGAVPETPHTPEKIVAEEKALAIELARFPDVATEAATTTDPSKIARYVFSLAQKFNNFYHACPVVGADSSVAPFRLWLSAQTLSITERALWLLGIETVGEM